MADYRRDADKIQARGGSTREKAGEASHGRRRGRKGPDPDPGGRTLPSGRGHSEKGDRRRRGGPGEGPSRGRG